MTKARANATAEAAKGDIRVGSGTNATSVLGVGTNGQALVANSGATTGLNWATPTDTTKVPLSTVTAKGDLIAATASGAVSNLAVGTNGQVLTAASGQTTGLQWATPVSGSMTLLSTTTLSGATVTISSISQSYTNLYGVISGCLNNTADGIFSMNPNAATVSGFQMKDQLTTVISSNTSTIRLSSPTGSGGMLHTNAGNAFQFTIYNYASTTAFKSFSSSGTFYDPGSSVYQGVWSSGGIATNTAISSLVFANSGGSLTAGTVLLYGVN